MAIRVEHGPSAALVGRMSYGAGEAMGKEESQRNLLNQWMQYYGVKKPAETQERIADKRLAYDREHLGVQKDWFDQNYVLDERRVGYEGDRVGIDQGRLGIDQSRLGLDAQRMSQDYSLAQQGLAMQGLLAQYEADTQFALKNPPKQNNYSGFIVRRTNPYAQQQTNQNSIAPSFNYQSVLGMGNQSFSQPYNYGA